MTVFLDPNFYCYTAEEWQSSEALGRLDRLLEILTDLSDAEESLELERSRILVLPDEFLLSSYQMNPNINNPPNDFYFRQYQRAILPSLTARRSDFQFDPAADADEAPDVELEDCVVVDAVKEFFSCVHRASVQPLTYAYVEDRRSFRLGSGAFSNEVCLDVITGKFFLDETSVFPLWEKADPERALFTAVCILWEKKRQSDRTWSDYTLNRIAFHDDFLPSLRKADFRDYYEVYVNRILFSLLQILCGRDINIREHSMRPQTVFYERQNHGKWNAYVFQEGPNQNDRRCSRIYYAKIQGAVLLNEYIENAH